ncbi:uncharacterized protein C8Q71DRAFT_766217 [Rhodofomes roseus]|uniref:Uncharacterized protein n=1 Tax=Rhodofomes roseus TaxID=34475 RepID=A0ABQ8KB23_9APHY|nr:uncharacterized protein C8Q71DRAFT_766217 [Rhodofomes roseus]KAH9834751.1 hypothetical protein C8Q71DRAFT_766217 [Rhodofomes roseus]
MSFLVGPISGALAAGGVYYGFSTMIQTRTEQHRTDVSWWPPLSSGFMMHMAQRLQLVVDVYLDAITATQNW